MKSGRTICSRFQVAIAEALEPRQLLSGGVSFIAPDLQFSGTYDPTAPAIADLNGDGNLDVIASGLLLFGKDGGTFDRVLTSMNGKSIAVNDMNGDGKPEVVTHDSLWITTSIPGVLGQRRFAPSNWYFSFSAVADMNRDGKLDIVGANDYGYEVDVMLGNGDLTFKPPITCPLGKETQSVTVADLNGDGNPDIVTGNFYDDSISIILGNGDGTFQTQKTLPTGKKPNKVAVADLNGDAIPDLVIPNHESDILSVLFGVGDGTFSGATNYAIDQPTSVVIADFNADGKPDLLASSATEQVAVLLGNGDGTFKDKMLFAAAEDVMGLAIGDLNRDGKLDLVAANYWKNLIILPGNGDGTLRTQRMFAVNPEAQNFAVADVNADGNSDVIAVGMSVLLGDGGGAFTTGQYINAKDTGSVAIADMNGDGKLDAVTTDYGNTVSVFLGNGDGSFLSRQTSTAGAGPFCICIADFNADGLLDAAVGTYTDKTISVLLGHGDGTFQNPISFPAHGTPQRVKAADLNGDAKPDLVVVTPGETVMGVFIGSGDGTFQDQVPYAVGRGDKDLRLADVNGDGKVDAVVSHYADGTVSVLLGDGDGTFQTQKVFSAGSKPAYLAVADVSGDANLDILVSSINDGTMSVLLGNGDGTFQSRAAFPAGPYGAYLDVADVNGDGRPDVLLANMIPDSIGVLYNSTWMPLAINGNGNTYIKRVGVSIGVWNDAEGASTAAATQLISTISAISASGTPGDDTFVLDFSGGSFIPAGGMSVDGGEGTDRLLILGTTATDSLRLVDGQLFINSSAISLDGIEQVTLGSNTPSALVELDSLTLEGASTVTLAAGATLRLSSLSLAPDASLDLSDGSLILQADPVSRDQLLASIPQSIASARNTSPLLWKGKGITSSAARDDASRYSGLAAVLNQDALGNALYSTFAGQAVDANSILVKYTLNGDADLSGKVDGADYFLIDMGYLSKYSTQPKTGYYNGDFDYNGLVDGADYFLIDVAYLGTRVPAQPAAAAPMTLAAAPSVKPQKLLHRRDIFRNKARVPLHARSGAR